MYPTVSGDTFEMTTYCFPVFVFLIFLQTVRGETCVSIRRVQTLGFFTRTLHASCQNLMCCMDQARYGEKLYSQIFTTECYVDNTTPSTSTSNNWVFVREDGCAYQEPMCLLPKTYIPGYIVVTVNSLEDCHSFCRWAINCKSSSFDSFRNSCYWNDMKTFDDALTYTEVDTYIRCDLTTTSTTTPTPTTTTTTTASTTTPAPTPPATTTTTTTISTTTTPSPTTTTTASTTSKSNYQ